MKRWTVDGEPDDRQLGEIAAILLNGGVVLMPTDTIYGLHATRDAADSLAAVKGRDEKKPFVTIAASVEQIAQLGADIPDVVRALWPGPLTAILNADRSTIAVRIPDVAWLRSLLEQTGPLLSTSANRAGQSPITDPNNLSLDLQQTIDGVVDAGTREGKASAIVDFTGAEPSVIREGDSRFAQILRKTLRKTL